MSGLHFIVSPNAGNGRGAANMAIVERLLKERGAEYSVAVAHYARHTVELAASAKAAGYQAVVVVGGDGTFREVAPAFVGGDTPLGLLPSGSGNDLSRALKIPTDPAQALEIVLGGKVRRMDVGRANEEYFFNVAGFGFDVDVLQCTEHYKAKEKNGSVAYLKGLLEAVLHLKQRDTQIESPGYTANKRVLILAAGNGVAFGGGMFITPKADPFDGKLDFCVAHDVGKPRLLRVLPCFLKGNHLQLTKLIDYFQGEQLRAVCQPKSYLELDGEIMPGTPVEFSLIKAALPVLIP